MRVTGAVGESFGGATAGLVVGNGEGHNVLMSVRGLAARGGAGRTDTIYRVLRWIDEMRVAGAVGGLWRR